MYCLFVLCVFLYGGVVKWYNAKEGQKLHFPIVFSVREETSSLWHYPHVVLLS